MFFFNTVSCKRYDMYSSTAIYNVIEEKKKRLKNGKTAVEYLALTLAK